MRALSSIPVPVTAVLLSCAVGAQVSLRDLPEIARQRAERLRPRQIAALEPYWQDLVLDYRENQQYLDGKLAEIAALGDSVVPLLLEKMAPAQGGSSARNLAANSRRVLQRLDPGSFVDALAEMARGKNKVARSEAIVLLGYANVPQAARVLASLLDRLDGDDLRQAVRSLRRLRHPIAASKAVALLGAGNRRLREEVLGYLTDAHATQVVDTVVQALSAETDDRLLSSYIEYFRAAAEGHAGATEALLPLLTGDRLDWRDRLALLEALATVAPKGHQATIRAMAEQIDGNGTSPLAVQAAVTMRALGDKQGVTRLKHTLDTKLRRRKREAGLYEVRASLMFAIGDFAEAADDYEKTIEYADGAAMARRAYEGLLQCDARRRKIQNMVKHMKASGMTRSDFDRLAARDEPFRTAMAHDRVQAFLKQLAKAR
ncbi:MAG TPA: hypothetical protein ENI87_04745 [bacterium]|nr:hypothetical protein [bacterium]